MKTILELVRDEDMEAIRSIYQTRHIDDTNSNGQTLLHIAAQQGMYDLCKYCLDNGASLQLKDTDGQTAVEIAIRFSLSPKVLELLLASTPTIDGLYDVAAACGYIYACILIRAEEKKRGIEFHHSVDLDVLLENEKYNSLGGSGYTPLEQSNVIGNWCRVYGKKCLKEEVLLPAGWQWITDWQVDLRWPGVDDSGWRYGNSFYDPENAWFPSETSPNSTLIFPFRRRRWFRTRKLLDSIESVGSSTQQSVLNYLDRAIDIYNQSLSASSLRDELFNLEIAVDIASEGLRLETDQEQGERTRENIGRWSLRIDEIKRELVINQTRNSPSPSPSPETKWQPDKDAPFCTNAICKKPFSLWVRRHHCRWCGLVFCDRCTQNRISRCEGMVLAPLNSTGSFSDLMAGETVRVCDLCFVKLSNMPIRVRSPTLPSAARGRSIRRRRRFHTDQQLTNQQQQQQEITGDDGDLEGDVSNCPVCNLKLDSSMTQADVEEHLNECLSSGKTAASGSFYVVSELQAEVADGECLICFEPFLKGNQIARLDCLCVFHKHCIDDWFSRGHKCPVHYV